MRPAQHFDPGDVQQVDVRTCEDEIGARRQRGFVDVDRGRRTLSPPELAARIDPADHEAGEAGLAEQRRYILRAETLKIILTNRRERYRHIGSALFGLGCGADDISSRRLTFVDLLRLQGVRNNDCGHTAEEKYLEGRHGVAPLEPIEV